MELDMTKGNPLKHIVWFTFPVFLGNLFQQFYNMVDAIIVGRLLGEKALGAVGCTGALMFLVVGFAIGMTQGFGVAIARAYGKKSYEWLRHLVFVSLVLGGAIAFVLTILATSFSMEILALMNTPSDIITLANSYIRVIYMGLVPLIYYNIAGAILRGVGDSKTPLYFLIISSVLNIVFDYSFIAFFRMSVDGAAYATVLSQSIAMVLVFIYMFKKFEILRPDVKQRYFDRETAFFLLKIGIPMAFNFSIISIGIMILQAAVNSFGSSAVAAFTGASRSVNIVTQIMPALGVGVATYTGQNFGAGDFRRIYKGVNQSAVLAIFIAIGCAIVITLFGQNVVKVFIENPSHEAMDYAGVYLDNIRYFLPLLGVLFVYRNALQAMDYQFVALFSGVLELLARFVICGLLLNQLGFLAVPLGECGSWLLASVVLSGAYYRWWRQNYKLVNT
ncbi:MAG: MATE family efflux transporter [Erysipelotrichaceae bacterium]|nr:MATE family efflux transporter [Erysipelotrichaceae bacterium]MDD3808945.1 MATE family efflux transporter [Erysipelotrichaceae bacterium]